MNNLAKYIPIAEKLERALTATGVDAAWVKANELLVKGYELPVAIQNILDDVNGSFLDTLDTYHKSPTTLSYNDLQDIAEKTDFRGLEQLLSMNGVHHHYHRTAGVEQQYRIKMDLKIVPTIFNQYNQPVAAIAWIGLEYEVGKIEFGESHWENRHVYVPIIRIIGREDLKKFHEPFHQLKVIAMSNLSNEVLGHWLTRLRALTPEEHLTLNEHNGHYA